MQNHAKTMQNHGKPWVLNIISRWFGEGFPGIVDRGEYYKSSSSGPWASPIWDPTGQVLVAQPGASWMARCSMTHWVIYVPLRVYQLILSFTSLLVPKQGLHIHGGELGFDPKYIKNDPKYIKNDPKTMENHGFWDTLGYIAKNHAKPCENHGKPWKTSTI